MTSFMSMMNAMSSGHGTSGLGLLDTNHLRALVRQGEQGAKVDPKDNTVRYEGASVTLVALASPERKPDMTWEVDGLVNPTIVVRPGTRVNVILVNADNDTIHAYELSPRLTPTG